MARDRNTQKKSASPKKKENAKEPKDSVKQLDLNIAIENKDVNETNHKEKETTTAVANIRESFNPEFRIYYQIRIENIYSLFSAGIIKPRRYESSDSHPDIQSINPSVLLFSNGALDYGERNIYLEVLLNKEEKANLKIIGNIAIFNSPLPISRIRDILVADNNLKKEIISTSILGNGGIIPEKIFTVGQLSTVYEKLTIYSIPYKDQKFNLNHYDRILGTFAFLSNYGILLSNRTGIFRTIPPHFLIAFSVVNENFHFNHNPNEKVEIFYKKLFGIIDAEQDSFKWLIFKMLEGSNFIDNDIISFTKVLRKNSDGKESMMRLISSLSSLSSSIGRKKIISEILNIDHQDKFYVYLFAMLRQYGNLSSESKSISRAELPSYISTGYGEYVFACLGFFYGYKSLRNYEDKIEVNDKVFSEILGSNKRLPLKFNLESQFDLTVIESVYQSVFNKNRKSAVVEDDDFKQSDHQNIGNLGSLTNYNYTEEIVLDKQIFTIKKDRIAGKIEELLSNYDMIPGLSKIGLLCNRNDIPYETLSYKQIITTKLKKEYLIYFKRNDLLTVLKEGRIKKEDVLDAILDSINFGEF